MRILLVEDDKETLDYLAKALREAGHLTEQATDGITGSEMASTGDYDVLVVDRMLPGRDGLKLIEGLREAGNDVPVLILSALGRVDDRVTGLRSGSDDYLSKPFSFAELLARIEVLARRRRPGEAETMYRVGDLELDRLAHSVTRGGKPILLQPREFRLLEYLMQHAGKVVTRTMLAGECLGLSFRSPDQCHRCPHFAPAGEDRQRLRSVAAADRSRRRLYDPRCASVGSSPPPHSSCRRSI